MKAKKYHLTTCMWRTSRRLGMTIKSLNSSHSGEKSHPWRLSKITKTYLGGSGSYALKKLMMLRNVLKRQTKWWSKMKNCKFLNLKRKVNAHANSSWKWAKTTMLRLRTKTTFKWNSSTSQSTRKCSKKEFEVYGQVTSVKIQVETVEKGDKEYKVHRGFGYVSFDKPEDALKALENMNGKVLMGKPL